MSNAQILEHLLFVFIYYIFIMTFADTIEVFPFHFACFHYYYYLCNYFYVEFFLTKIFPTFGQIFSKSKFFFFCLSFGFRWTFFSKWIICLRFFGRFRLCFRFSVFCLTVPDNQIDVYFDQKLGIYISPKFLNESKHMLFESNKGCIIYYYTCKSIKME